MGWPNQTSLFTLKYLISTLRHIRGGVKNKGSERSIPLIGASLWAAKQSLHNFPKSNFLFPRYTNQDGCNANSASAAINKWLTECLKIVPFIPLDIQCETGFVLLDVHQISLMPSVDGQQVGLVMLMGVGILLRSKQNGW